MPASDRSALRWKSFADKTVWLSTQTALLDEQAAVAATINSALHTIAEAKLDCPADWSLEAVEKLREQVAEQLRRADLTCEAAAKWRSLVETEGESHSRRIGGGFALVAGPLSAISVDGWFADAPGRDTVFDLVIVVEAHRLNELECVQAARKGKRWVFIGEPALPSPEISQRFRSTISRPVSTAKGQPDFYHRLWELLHQEIWVTVGDRLCCRLQSVARPMIPDRSGICGRPTGYRAAHLHAGEWNSYARRSRLPGADESCGCQGVPLPRSRRDRPRTSLP